MTILVTGGTGYIGIHTCIELLQAGYSVVAVDNLSNSYDTHLSEVKKITGKTLFFEKADIREQQHIEKIINTYNCDTVIHFAGLKSVGESVSHPLDYYSNNIAGTINLLKAMQNTGINKLVFSSSATVYGNPQYLPIDEKHPLGTTNPYARTKLMIEEILEDICFSDSSWSAVILRYFNPVGAHTSGLISETPKGTPNNLMPYILQVATGKQAHLNVWGNDYPTHDGTGIRDYIHVVDLAEGHIKALRLLDQTGCRAVNLGTGTGYSVLDVIHAFKKASGVAIPYQLAERRAGDIATCYADATLAKDLLGWQAGRDLSTMCKDSFRAASLHNKSDK